MPLHIFLSTWIGTTFGLLDVAKALKDVVLVVGFLAVVAASFKKPWFKVLVKDKLVWLITTYTCLTIFLALIFNTDKDAEILGVVYNLRFLLFFLYGMLLARLFTPGHVLRNALKVVLSVACVVLVFGIVQYALLPDDILTRVGYSREAGVLPAFFIDNKPDLERVMSTLRDPNSFGSYIIIILSIALAYFLSTKNQELKKITAGLIGLSVLTLWYTFSRSAWIGAMLAVITILILRRITTKDFRLPRRHLVITTLFISILLLFIIPLRNTYFVQNVIFHADQSTVLEDPNQLRQRFVRESLQAAAKRPLGYGPGTAGLASIRNEKQGTILNENYYLQLLHEVGIFGLLLFLAILLLVATRLYRQLPHTSAIALLAALIGLVFTNLLVHIWSNEAVAYTFWGLTGLVLAINTGDTRRPRVRKNAVNVVH